MSDSADGDARLVTRRWLGRARHRDLSVRRWPVGERLRAAGAAGGDRLRRRRADARSLGRGPGGDRSAGHDGRGRPSGERRDGSAPRVLTGLRPGPVQRLTRRSSSTTFADGRRKVRRLAASRAHGDAGRVRGWRAGACAWPCVIARIFGAVLCASPGAGYRPPAELQSPLPRAYFVAGTEEPFFLENASRWAAAWRAVGSGHRHAGARRVAWRPVLAPGASAMVAWAFAG